METFLFTTAFIRPNGEILPGEVSQLNDGFFKFKASGLEYFFIISKDNSDNWYWVDGHTASLERVMDLGEKVEDFFAV